MAPFDFIFALFGLLLGLSLAEVLSGFARAIQARLDPGRGLRLGWLTPLLGAFVLLDLLSFWNAAWVSRSHVTVSGHVLLAVALFTGAYHLAAALVFPREIGRGEDLDGYFFRVRRIVIGVMLALLVCQLVWYASVPTLAALLQRPKPVLMTVLLVGLMIAAMAVRSPRAARWAMGALVARYVLSYLLF